MKNNRGSRFSSPCVQDTAAPTCTHGGFTAHSDKVTTEQNSMTLLNNPNVVSNSPIIKEVLNKKLLCKGFICMDTSKSSMSYYNTILDLELHVYDYHPYVSARYVKVNKNHHELDGSTVEDVLKWLDVQTISGIYVECQFNTREVSIAHSNEPVKPTTCQLEGVDKMCIPSLAFNSTTVKDSIGYHNASGCRGRIEYISGNQVYIVDLPSLGDGTWWRNFSRTVPTLNDDMPTPPIYNPAQLNKAELITSKQKSD